MLTTCSRGLSIFGDGVYSIQTWASSVGVLIGRRIEQPVGLIYILPYLTKITRFMDAETSDTRGLRILSLGIQKLASPTRSYGTNHSITDGGDARCISQLYLLREFMGRLESRTGKKTRICDFFDLIVAVDTAS